MYVYRYVVHFFRYDRSFVRSFFLFFFFQENTFSNNTLYIISFSQKFSLLLRVFVYVCDSLLSSDSNTFRGKTCCGHSRTFALAASNFNVRGKLISMAMGMHDFKWKFVTHVIHTAHPKRTHKNEMLWGKRNKYYTISRLKYIRTLDGHPYFLEHLLMTSDSWDARHLMNDSNMQRLQTKSFEAVFRFVGCKNLHYGSSWSSRAI